ncbi:MAG: glycosyltransferase family 39 protein, partial [Acidimicrobiales bacterium]
MHLEDPQVRTSEAAELVRQAPLGEATLAEEPRPEQFAPPPGVKTGAPTWRSAVGLPADWRLALIIGAVVAVAIWLRFATASAEWLDEALTVNIAAAPISDLPRLLHRDGAPPLYYAALHYWIVA